jgi:hypothetical protein
MSKYLEGVLKKYSVSYSQIKKAAFLKAAFFTYKTPKKITLAYQLDSKPN